MNVLGYYYGGLEGLGISFLVYYIIHFIAIRVITKIRYNFYFEEGFYTIFNICVLICGLSYALTYIENLYLRYSSLLVLSLLSVVFSYIQLDKKMDIKELISKIFKRNR